MSTYTQIIYQIIFSTKNREHTLSDENRIELFKYIAGILKNQKCHLYAIGGVSDHIHIIIQLHPSVALASLVKDIKLASSQQIKSNGWFMNFDGWQEGYGAFTYSNKEKEKLIEYVKNQEAHHAGKTFKEELIEILKEQGVEYNEKYLM
jgi:putative transposase